MIKNRILFIFTVVPYPVRANGVSIRYFPLIQFLAGRYDIDIILIANENSGQEDIGELKRYCRNFFYIQDPKYRKHGVFETWSTKVNFFVPWTPPISLVVDGGRDIVGEISEYVRDMHYGATVWVGAGRGDPGPEVTSPPPNPHLRRRPSYRIRSPAPKPTRFRQKPTRLFFEIHGKASVWLDSA